MGALAKCHLQLVSLVTRNILKPLEHIYKKIIIITFVNYSNFFRILIYCMYSEEDVGKM